MKIALSGKMMSGKTIIADYLVSQYHFTEFALADRMKRLAVELFDMDPEHKDRDLMQMLGMKMRELDSNVWIRYVMRVIAHFPESDILVSDIRFKNEFAAMRQTGFIMVQCYVGNQKQKQRLNIEMPDMPDELRYHISEIDLDYVGQVWSGMEWDNIIRNDGCSMDQLLMQVDLMIEFERKAHG